jgi:hypothetical protein
MTASSLLLPYLTVVVVIVRGNRVVIVVVRTRIVSLFRSASVPLPSHPLLEIRQLFV